MRTNRLRLSLSERDVFCEYIPVRDSKYSMIYNYHLYFKNPFSYTEDDIQEIIGTFENTIINRSYMYLNDYKYVRLKDQLIITIEAIKHSNQLE